MVFAVAACGGQVAVQPSSAAEAEQAAPEEKEGEPVEAAESSEVTWPQKQMTLVVSFKAGGALDVNARLLAQYWSKYLGVNINVENHEGANGQVGTTYVYQSNVEDMLVLCSAQTYLSSTALSQDSVYKPDDFQIINFTEIDPSCVVCMKEKWSSFEELNEDILANPGKYKFAVNAGGGAAVVAALLIDHYGWDVKTINYSGGNDLHTAVLAGECDFACGQMEAAIGYSDHYNVLTLCGDERHALFPETPTLKEILGDDAPFMGTFRFVAVTNQFRDTYPEYFKLLCDSLEKVYSDPDYLKALEDANLAEFMSWKGPEYSQQLNMQIDELTKEYIDVMNSVK